MTDHEEPLSDAERDAYAQLPRDAHVPAALEDRVVDSLRRAGYLQRRTRARYAWGAAAAALVFLAGVAAGQWRAARAAVPVEADGQRYVLLLYETAQTLAADEPALVEEYTTWARTEAAAGRLELGEKLDEGVLRLGADIGAPAVPSGLFIIRAASYEDAAATAGRCPHLRHGGAVVMRPIDETDSP